MRENFERYVDKITQNVIALSNIWKIQIRIKVIGQRRVVESRPMCMNLESVGKARNKIYV
jgi:hypothetical protein